MSAIRAEGLTKSFGSRLALEDLTLEVTAGEIFGYLGPNGAGKTTTIRLLLDLIRPTAGAGWLLGGSGSDVAVRARVGYLPAELRIEPSYTTNDIVAFFGRLRGGIDRARVDELLDRFALDPGRRIGELSTGNRRKVGIVQAFMHHPELLLLDEPSTGLDPLLQLELHRLVRESVDGGATVFLSSHALHEVDALADRVAILRHGHLVTVAPLAELRARARQRIDVHLASVPDVDRLRTVPGVVEATADGHVVHLVVEGHAAPLVRALGDLEVVRIATRNDDLASAFLGFYGSDGP